MNNLLYMCMPCGGRYFFMEIFAREATCEGRERDIYISDIPIRREQRFLDFDFKSIPSV